MVLCFCLVCSSILTRETLRFSTMRAVDTETTALFLTALRSAVPSTTHVEALGDHAPDASIIDEEQELSNTVVDAWVRRVSDGVRTRASMFVGAEIRFARDAARRQFRITFERPDEADRDIHHIRDRLSVDHGLTWKPRYFGGSDFTRCFEINVEHGETDCVVADIAEHARAHNTSVYSLVLRTGLGRDATLTPTQFSITVSL